MNVYSSSVLSYTKVETPHGSLSGEWADKAGYTHAAMKKDELSVHN